MNHLNTTLLAMLLSSTLSAQSPCLIASYPFNGNANDVTGNGHDGTVAGPNLAIDRFGNPAGCYSFDGIDDRIVLSGAFAGNNGSFTGWVSAANFNVPNQIMVCNGPDATNNHFNLTLSSAQELDGLNQRLFCVDDARQCDASRLSYTISDPELSAQTWTFVAMTADDVALHLFINGTEVSTVTDGSIETNNGNWFDDLCGGSSQVLLGSNLFGFYAGRMDDAAFYGCALTAAQVDSIYQAQSNGQPCLVANYTFNGSANDMTGNGHDGTVYGATLAIDRFGNDSSCYHFNGVNDFIKLDGTWTGNNGTVSAWIYPETLSQFNPIFSRRDSTMNGNALEMVVNTAGGQDDSRLYNGTDLRDCVGGASLYFTNSDPMIVPAVWTHVAMTADDSGIHLFINCEEVTTYGDNNTGLWFDDMCPLNISTYIGMLSRPINTEHFIGRIDDVRVYDCALSAEEIAALCDINTATVELAQRTEIRAYPNPTTGQLRLSNISKGAVPQVFDATGRKIPVATHQQGSEVAIDLSTYPSGLYVVRVAEHSFSIVRQ